MELTVYCFPLCEYLLLLSTWLNSTYYFIIFNEYLPSSLPSRAMAYMQKLWPGLIEFLNKPKDPLDNNICERELRSPVMSRKNFSGFRTMDGADIGMVYYSIIETQNCLNTI